MCASPLAPSISSFRPRSSGMIAPLPNCFSMAATATATALSFSFALLDMGGSFSNDGATAERVAKPQQLHLARPRGVTGRHEGGIVIGVLDVAVLEGVVGGAADLPLAQRTLGPAADRLVRVFGLEGLVSGQADTRGAQ